MIGRFARQRGTSWRANRPDCLALLLLLAAPALAGDDAKQVREQARGAVERGRAALERKLRATPLRTRACADYALGKQALYCFALLRAGTRPRDLDDAFKAMRRVRFTHTYCVSTYLLAVDARSVVRRASRDRRRLVSYKRRRPDAGDLKELARGVAWLLRARVGQGAWTYTSPAERPAPLPVWASAYDHSNTQLAIYALHAASCAGVAVEPAAWRGILGHVARTQALRGPRVDLREVEREGEGRTRVRKDRWSYGAARGWAYKGSGSREEVKTTMTAAGISCAAMGLERLRGLPVRTEGHAAAPIAIRDGVAWLTRTWTAVSTGTWAYYELWTIEKACSSVGVEELGKDRHWWTLGARWLLQQQDRTGLWRDNPIDTSFALLFLNRGTLPVLAGEAAPAPAKTGAREDAGLNADWSRVWLPDGGRVDLRQSFEALTRTRSAKVARDLLRELDAGMAAAPVTARVRSLPWLLGLLEAKRSTTRRWAEREVRDLLGPAPRSEWAGWLAEWLAVEEGLARRDPRGAGRRGADAAKRLLTARGRPEALRRAAAQALVRLRAVESADALIAALDAETLGERRWMWTMLSALVGRPHGFDPAASAPRRRGYLAHWRAWWKREGPAWAAREARWRDVGLLAHAATREAAWRRLDAQGLVVVPALIAGLEDPALRAEVHRRLVAKTGQRLPAEVAAWRAWWAKRGK